LRLDLGRMDLEVGNLQQAVRRLELAVEDARASASDQLQADSCRELARATGLLQDRQRSDALITESFEASCRAHQPRAGASWRSLVDLATACTQVDFPERARGFLLDALQAAEREQSATGKLLCASLMAEAHLHAREWSEAENRLQQALGRVSQLGDRTMRCQLLTDQGRLCRLRGDVETAKKKLEQAVKLAKTISCWECLKRAEQEVEMLELIS
jgi:tetratricopeptide (TPR) repeat protein